MDGGVPAVASVLGAPLFAQARKAFGSDQGWILVLGSYLPILPPVKTVNRVNATTHARSQLCLTNTHRTFGAIQISKLAE